MDRRKKNRWIDKNGWMHIKKQLDRKQWMARWTEEIKNGWLGRGER